jgi:hypothetical protein
MIFNEITWLIKTILFFHYYKDHHFKLGNYIGLKKLRN